MAPRVFTCTHCDYQNQNLSNVKTHIIRNHENRGKKNSKVHKYKCDDTFENSIAMNAHIENCESNSKTDKESGKANKNGVSKKLYDCWKCNFQSLVPVNVVNHMSKIHNISDPKMYKCPSCNEKYRTQRQLQIHEEHCNTNLENKSASDIKTNNREMKESNAQQEILKINDTKIVKLKLHKVDATAKNSEISNGSDSVNPPKKSQEIIKERYKCLKCDFKAQHAFQLLRHVNMVHKADKATEPVLHKCRLCLKGFTNIILLNSHIKSKCGTMVDVAAMKREEFKCSKCKYKTFHSNLLQRHVLMIHEENNRSVIKCKYCNKGFKSSQTLKSHSKNCSKAIQVDDVPIKAVESKRTITKSVKMGKVIASKKIVLYSCRQCDYRTEHKNLLRNHKASEHKKISTSHLSAYTCEICKEGFQYITEFKPHVMKCKQINGVTNSANGRRPPARVSLDSALPATTQKAIPLKRERGGSLTTIPVSSVTTESEVPIKRERGTSLTSTSISSLSRVSQMSVPIKREVNPNARNAPVPKRFLHLSNEPIKKKVSLPHSKNPSVSRKLNLTIPTHNLNGSKIAQPFIKTENIKEEEDLSVDENVDDTMEENSEVEMFKCLVCNYQSKYSWAVRVHMGRTHQVDNPKIHKCKYCGIMIQHLRDLRYHVGKSYCVNTNADFANQRLAAEKIRRYNCSRCSYKAAYTHAIRGHMKRIHGMPDVKFQWCQSCRQVFMEVEQFETHKCVVKKELPVNGTEEIEKKNIIKTEPLTFLGPFHVCSKCEAAFDDKISFDTHTDSCKFSNSNSENNTVGLKSLQVAIKPLSKQTVEILTSPKSNIKMIKKKSVLIKRACSMMIAKKIDTENEVSCPPSKETFQVQHRNSNLAKPVKPSRTKPKLSISAKKERVDVKVNAAKYEMPVEIENNDNKQTPIQVEHDFIAENHDNVENHESENMLQKYLGVETTSSKGISIADFCSKSPTADYLEINLVTNGDFHITTLQTSSNSLDADQDSADDEKIFHEMTSCPPVDISCFSQDEFTSFPASEMSCLVPGEINFLPDATYYPLGSELGNFPSADVGDTMYNTFEYYSDVDISKNSDSFQQRNTNLNKNTINSGLMINGDVTWSNSPVGNATTVPENEYEFKL